MEQGRVCEVKHLWTAIEQCARAARHEAPGSLHKKTAKAAAAQVMTDMGQTGWSSHACDDITKPACGVASGNAE